MSSDTAGVLIDDHGLGELEVDTMRMGLDLYVNLCLGNFERITPYIFRGLGQELICERAKMKKILGLINQLHSVLWKDREAWTVYDWEHCPPSGFLAYELMQRLTRNEREVVKAVNHRKIPLNRRLL